MTVLDAVSSILSLLKEVAPHDGGGFDRTVVLRQECSKVEDEIVRLKLILGWLEARHAESGRNIVSPSFIYTGKWVMRRFVSVRPFLT